MRTLGRESAIVQISTRSFSDHLPNKVGEQERRVFEVGEAGHFVLTSLPVEQE
jgi:hypothetical protein